MDIRNATIILWIILFVTCKASTSSEERGCEYTVLKLGDFNDTNIPIDRPSGTRSTDTKSTLDSGTKGGESKNIIITHRNRNSSSNNSSDSINSSSKNNCNNNSSSSRSSSNETNNTTSNNFPSKNKSNFLYNIITGSESNNNNNINSNNNLSDTKNRSKLLETLVESFDNPSNVHIGKGIDNNDNNDKYDNKNSDHSLGTNIGYHRKINHRKLRTRKNNNYHAGDILKDPQMKIVIVTNSPRDIVVNQSKTTRFPVTLPPRTKEKAPTEKFLTIFLLTLVFSACVCVMIVAIYPHWQSYRHQRRLRQQQESEQQRDFVTDCTPIRPKFPTKKTKNKVGKTENGRSNSYCVGTQVDNFTSFNNNRRKRDEHTSMLSFEVDDYDDYDDDFEENDDETCSVPFTPVSERAPSPIPTATPTMTPRRSNNIKINIKGQRLPQELSADSTRKKLPRTSTHRYNQNKIPGHTPNTSSATHYNVSSSVWPSWDDSGLGKGPDRIVNFGTKKGHAKAHGHSLKDITNANTNGNNINVKPNNKIINIDDKGNIFAKKKSDILNSNKGNNIEIKDGSEMKRDGKIESSKKSSENIFPAHRFYEETYTPSKAQRALPGNTRSPYFVYPGRAALRAPIVSIDEIEL